MHLELVQQSPTLADRQPTLTDRQREIVAFIAAGYSNEEVGGQLGISPRTVKAHCDTLRQKLGVDRRRQIPAAFYRLTGTDPFMCAALEPAAGRG